jgi:xanthine dehydrogenase molybdenum-binding subunit
VAIKLVGENYTTPDLHAKVTGRAKYAEDYRAEGMLFTKLLVSPMPHAKVTRLDTSRALALAGVKAIITAEDLPGGAAGATLGEGVQALSQGERAALTLEPVYQGEPIVAVAAVDEATAAEAIELIDIEFQPLPFNVDPIESLRPGSANARTEGNTWVQPPPPPADAAGGGRAGRGGRGGFTPPQIGEIKWTEADFANAKNGLLPTGEATTEWTYGDVDAGFAQADLVLDETFVSQSTGHQPLETRTAMAYWQNGKLYLHGSTQSTVQTIRSVARWAGLENPEDVVIISEYTGGGFGSKIPGAISMAIPAILSKKTNAPVMMRITREDEHFIGRARSGVHARVKAGFRKDGRLLALDLFSVGDNGPYDRQGDYGSVGNIASLAYQPVAMRFRGITVLTNTPPRTSQRAPGGMQAIGVMEPVIAKAAKQLGIDQVEMHLINSPEGKAKYGAPNAAGRQGYVTSTFIKEALEKGRDLFKWEERKARSGQRTGSKVRGVGVAVSTFSGGSIGFDGLFIIKPDGRLTVQSGIGNHGTESVTDVHRVAAEMIGMPWDKVDIVWGNTEKGLPWTCISAGSQTAHAMTRAAHAAATDAIRKLQEIAAHDFGGRPEDYVVANERVTRKGGGRSMTFAQAAQRAIALGGVYDGHELPQDINGQTKAAATQLAGQGLMAVAKDAYSRDGSSMSFVAGFAEVEVDVETGAHTILDYLAVADVGTVLHPRVLGGQVLGGSMLGIGHAVTQRWAYDQHYGAALARRFYQNRPPTILDAPQNMAWDAVNIADPETPTGIRGVGEPPVGAGYGAVMNAILEAVGYEAFRRSPATSDVLLTAIENGGMRTHEPLTTNI